MGYLIYPRQQTATVFRDVSRVDLKWKRNIREWCCTYFCAKRFTSAGRGSLCAARFLGLNALNSKWLRTEIFQVEKNSPSICHSVPEKVQ